MVVFEELSNERAKYKTQMVFHALENASPSVVLYQLLFRVSGYKGNELAYENLSLSIPIEFAAKFKNNGKILYALYIGWAGLLPAKPEDGFSKCVQYPTLERSFHSPAAPRLPHLYTHLSHAG